MRSIVLGIFAALFFATTFVLNRAMGLDGGSWIWTASLRYLFTLPFLLAIVIWRKNFTALWQEIHRHPLSWLGWSFVGFVLFYAPLSFASVYSPGWLMAGTWQITIISGSLLAPLFWETRSTPEGPVQVRGKIPVRGLLMSTIILLGVILMQAEQAKAVSVSQILLGIVPVIIASFAYPLGNRKMMVLCGGRLDTYQRVLGMTLCSLPFWLILSACGLITAGMPQPNQVSQSLIVAVSSGVVATVLFFKATDLVKHDMSRLAAVEATQSLEVLFALIGEVLILSAPLPPLLAWFGMGLIILGMTLHSFFSQPRRPGRSATGGRSSSPL